MLAEWVERLLSYASGALDAIRADESFPAFMQWAHSEGVNYSGGDEALAVALAPVLWSQTPLVRLDFARESLAPPGRSGEFFGLYAIAGTITVWMGPLLVEQFTLMSGDQRIGMVSINLLFLIGLSVLLTVRMPERAI